MAVGGLIGALRVTLGIDVSEFEKGTTRAQAQMRTFQREFDRAGKKWQQIGKDLTTYVTLPVLGAGVAVAKMAGDFESGMNRVKISSQATTSQMALMREQALKIGADTTKSASEAADGMDMLAKAGMNATDILDGGAKAVVALAEAAGSDLDPAAAAITDTFAQFHKTTKDLPQIINRITGAVNESKFEFSDFQGGMAQAGGVAASAGVSFEDFTAALAGTAAQFASGSDAGTSFKTFIQRTIPQTKQAAEMMEKYGLSFYDAQGKMLPMIDIAEQLNQKFSDMSNEDRNKAFTTMFGQDAIRTAIGLMNLGAKGFEDMSARIAATDATQQAADRMRGFNGQLEQLKGAIETLAIRIGDSGLLEALTGIVKVLGEFIDWLGQLSPTTLKVITIVAALAAALGPLALVFGTSLKAIGLLLPALGLLAPAFAAVASVIETALIAAMVTLNVGLGPLIAIIGAVVVAVGGLYLAWKNWDKIKPIVIALYNTVKTYMLDKLSVVWNGVKKGIDAVDGFFHGLWDAVVGHSYIPDMVDGIRDHMGRLDQVMVEPARKGTEAAKEAFRSLQQEVSGILDRLFPEQARQNKFNDELKTLEEGMKRMGFSADETAEAVKRLRKEWINENRGEGFNLPEWMTTPPDIDGDEGEIAKKNGELLVDENSKAIDKVLADTEDRTAKMAEAWANMARDAVGSMRNMVNSFKSGDILGGITGILDLVGQVAGLFKSGGPLGAKTATPTFNRGPGFSTGGSFKVGGSGGVDSQNVRIRASPGEIIDVRRGDQGRREPVTVLVQANDYFDAKVESLSSPLADRAATRGMLGGAQLAQRNQHRRERGSLRG